MKSKVWLMILGGVLAACLGLSALLLLPGEGAAQAEVYSDGKLLYTLDLLTDTQVTVEGKTGTNVITVRGGKIAVTEADCPDGYCMGRGFCNSGAQIVCLPNRLVIRFTGRQELDSIAG